jgi:hypothetical protein
MIELIDIESKEKVRLSYTMVAREFLDSPVSEEERGFIVNMMVYLDFMERRRGLKIVKLNSADWEGLLQATALCEEDSSREVA